MNDNAYGENFSGENTEKKSENQRLNSETFSESGTSPAAEPVRFSEKIEYSFRDYTENKKEESEKKGLLKASAAIGISMTFVYLAMVYWSVPTISVFGLFGIGPQRAVTILRNEYISQLVQVLVSALSFVLPFAVSAVLLKENIGKTGAFGPPKKGTAVKWFFIGFGFCCFSNIAVQYAGNLLEQWGITYPSFADETPSGANGFILSLIATAVMPALVEEFACRGIAMGLLKKYGDTFALVTSAVIFGIMHGNFDQMPFAIMVGLALGFIRLKTGSIFVCMAVHCANNLLAVLVDYAKAYVSSAALNLIYTVFVATAVVAAVYLLIAEQLKDRDALKIPPAKTELSEKEKYIRYFASPFTLVFVILFLVQAIKYFFV